jgi:2,4-dienoyl-CoA reductase-like NADH-dependent reductase (Old Yellow Enzyme family)
VPGLFSPLTIRNVTFPNRAWVSPMCQYSAVDGVVGDWHLVHLGALAAGRAGLVLTEATGVTPEGRISPACPGIWTEAQADAWQRIVDYVHGQDVLMGIQLAHAGRKASTARPWEGHDYVAPEAGGWPTVGPSALAFDALPAPARLSGAQITLLVTAFHEAAVRANRCGFDVVELHAAHGYLMHQFLSPLSNVRDDEFGGSLENRMRFPLLVAKAVREAWNGPLFVRISTTDWTAGGWDVEQSIVLVERLRDLGVDLIDASSGGLDPGQEIPNRVDYQTSIAAQVRERTGIAVGAVGRITDPAQADELIASGQADAVLLARQLLRDPHWPLRAAHELGAEIEWVPQYRRGSGWQS